MTKRGKGSHPVALLVLLALVLCCMAAGTTAFAAGPEAAITEDFSGYAAGAVNAAAMSSFTFGNAGAFSIEAVEGHGNVLKGSLGSAAAGNVFDFGCSFSEKRITFDFMMEGSVAAYNGLYLFLNTEGSARVIASPGSSPDLFLQNGSGQNAWQGSKGFRVSVWYTMVIEYTEDALRFKACPAGTSQDSWDYDGVNIISPAQYGSSLQFVLLNGDGYTGSIYFDNILVEDLSAGTEEPTDVEPQYSWFFDDFSAYDYGTLKKESGASVKYSLLKDVNVADPVNDGVSKVLSLEASGEQPQFSVACTLLDKQVQFDFLYDHDFVSYGGIYVTMHSEPGVGDYYFSITPTLSNVLTVSVGPSNLGSKSLQVSPQVWYSCKARLYDNNFWIKVWPAGEEEPAAWDFLYAVPPLRTNPADACGIMAHENGAGSNTVYIDNFSVKTWNEIVKAEYTISLNLSDPAAGSVSGAGDYLEDGNATVTAVSNPGYRFVGWRENGEIVSTDPIYRFMVSADRSMTAEFEPVELEIFSFMANGMTQEAVIDSQNKTIQVRLASDVDMQNVLCYFYKEVDARCSVEPCGYLDLSAGVLRLDDWTVYATRNQEMIRFYVDGANGDDSNNGLTCCKAFRTIQKAIDAASEQNDWTGDVVIQIANGDYVLDETLKFRADNSAEQGYALILEGEDAENTVISSGIRLTGWIESATVPGAWEIDAPALPDGIDYSRDLYVNGTLATLARGDVIRPGGWTYTDRENMEKNAAGYLVDGLDMSTWRNQSDIEFVYEVGWTYVIVPVERIEAAGADSQVVMNAAAYQAANEKNGLQIVDPGYIQNAFELLDEAGEWYFDRQAQKIYYIPEAGVNPNELRIVIPTLDQLLDADGTDGDPVYGLTLKNLAFRYASYLKAHTDGHADIQANFTAGLDYLSEPLNNMNKTPGAVTFDYAQGIRVEGCSFSCLSAAGLDYGVGVCASTIVGNRLEQIGASGIQIGTVKVRDAQPLSAHGYADGRFVENLNLPQEPNRITHDILVLSNELHQIGTQFKGAIAIMAGYASDVTISHNTISHTSYSAISAGWGWGGIDNDPRAIVPVVWEYPSVQERYVIENNDISEIMLELHDGGGIYTLSDMPGSVISGNVVRGSGHIGIYNDEASGGFAEIAENITIDAPQPYFYHNVRNAYADRMKATENVMRDNYWNTVPSGDALYDGILACAGVLPGVRVPALPADVPAAGEACTCTLTLVSAPDKTVYNVGETLDLTGLEMAVVYHCGLTETVAVTADMVSGFDSASAGAQTITVAHAGQSVSFVITVRQSSAPARPAVPGVPSGVRAETAENDGHAALTFLDVKPGDWLAEDVAFVAERGIMNGVGGNRFSPDATVTRAMVVTILWRMEHEPDGSGKSPFCDVADGSWYSDAVIWASENGIVYGYGNGKFGPDDAVTREQLAAILYRYAKYIGRSTGDSADLSSFHDADAVSDYAGDAMRWAVAESLIRGMDAMLLPQGWATRAQIAAIIHRFLIK